MPIPDCLGACFPLSLMVRTPCAKNKKNTSFETTEEDKHESTDLPV